jgi:hypothetical protein
VEKPDGVFEILPQLQVDDDPPRLDHGHSEADQLGERRRRQPAIADSQHGIHA